MTRSLVILGAAGNAYDVLDIVDALNATGEGWTVAGFLDDTRREGTEYAGFPVLGGLGAAANLPGHWFISTIRNEGTFRRSTEILGMTGVDNDRFATLVHPGAFVSARARMGRGIYVNFGASVAGGVDLGDQVSLGPGCIVGHNATIGAHTIVAPGAIISGSVSVGTCCYIGAGSSIRQSLRVGDRSLVGMSAVVVEDVAADTVVVGNPARALEPSQSGS